MDAAAYTLGGVALGFVGQAFLARQRERTEVRLAGASRLLEWWTAIYDRLALGARRQLAVVDRIHPVVSISGAPAGPDDITVDEGLEIQAQVDTWTAQAVAEAHRAFNKALWAFEGVVRTQETIHLQTTGTAGIGAGQPYMLIETAREEVRARYDELITAIRGDTELSSGRISRGT